jgi:hypothetical protein
MKDLLAKLAELDKDIKTINETTNPLGETASMNISMTGDNADEVAQLVNIMRTGNTPDAKAVSPMDMPSSDHMPMDKALSIVKMPMDGPMDMDGPADSPMDDMPRMGPKDDEADEDMSGGFSSSTTEPDEQYFDTQTMTRDLAGGINREKGQHAPAADGDNPIAVEDDLDAQIESIKDELYAALAEKTGKDAPKPDFPDLDNDGNKEEPMSQAIAQRDDDDEEDTDEADTSYSITGKSKEANAELARLAELSGVSAPEADIDEADTEDTSYSIKGKSEEANAELARIAELSGVSAPDEKADEDTSYSIKGKSEEANAELARIANVDEWETDPEEHNQAAIESWYDEVVSAITDRNITFPIADNEIQKIADDVIDDWSNGRGPSEHTILSIINSENDDPYQKDEATLEHEATLEAIRNISFR